MSTKDSNSPSMVEKSEEKTGNQIAVAELNYHVDYPEESGDFTLLSADGVAFGIDVLHLRSASAVLRETLSFLNDTPRLEFTDASIEDQWVVKLVLDIITGKELGPACVMNLEDIKLTDRTLQFAAKYDCPSITRHLLARLEIAAAHVIYCQEIFLLVAPYNEFNTGGEALRNERRRLVDPDRYEPPRRYWITENIEGKNSLDLHYLELDKFSKIPHSWILAFTRAKDLSPTGMEDEKGREIIGDEFVNFLIE